MMSGDILDMLLVRCQLIVNRYLDSPDIQREYPEFLEDFDRITMKSKSLVIQGLLEVFKFQHSIQIIRWIGKAHDHFDPDAWRSVSAALANRMI